MILLSKDVFFAEIHLAYLALSFASTTNAQSVKLAYKCFITIHLS